jgi:hypothetical protein
VQELAKQEIDVHNLVINQVIVKGPTDFSELLDARIRVSLLCCLLIRCADEGEGWIIVLGLCSY